MVSPESVAVVTRTKNRTILLKRAVESVLNQTHRDWVHVIVNDGGHASEVDDLIASYSSQYAGRVKVVHNADSIGMEAASNVGIKSVDSEFVVIHDDDDSWNSEFLTKCVAYLQVPRAGLDFRGVVSRSILINEKIEGNRVIELDRRVFNPGMSVAIPVIALIQSNLFSPISFLMRRNVFGEIGFYDESLPVLGDWEFNLRFLNRFDIGVVEDTLAYYHHRPMITSGNMGNSVVAGVNMHGVYHLHLRNRIVRDTTDRYSNIKQALVHIFCEERRNHDPIHTFLTIVKYLVKQAPIKIIQKLKAKFRARF